MPGAVHATPVLDKSVNASPDTGFRFSDCEDLVALQTFTVGTLGKLSGVSVGVVRVGSHGGPPTIHDLTQSLTIGIWKWEDPVPTSYDPYFSMTLQPSQIPEEVDGSVPNWIYVDLSSWNPDNYPGQMFAIGLYEDTDTYEQEESVCLGVAS